MIFFLPRFRMTLRVGLHTAAKILPADDSALSASPEIHRIMIFSKTR